MLYPDFKELLSYESAARGIGLHLKKKYSSEIAGNFHSSFKGQGMEFDEVRQYVYGDSVRDIDWRVTARTGSTHVKVFKEERQRNVLIAVDHNDYMNFGTRGTFKNVQAAKIASILGFAANKSQDKVGMYIFGNQKNRFTFLKPVSSNKSLFSGLKSLCVPGDDSGNYSLEGAVFNLKRIGATPNILFIISDFRYSGQVLEKNLYLLGRRPEIVFINITDDNDFYVPDIGKMVLQYGRRRYILNTSDRRGMEKYRRRYEESQKSFRKLAARLNARVININTKSDPLKELSIGLRR